MNIKKININGGESSRKVGKGCLFNTGTILFSTREALQPLEDTEYIIFYRLAGADMVSA
ncbi:hypothetical protein P0092_18600 [Ruminiclostridium papyrosolvens DSM 2782]|uniref:hypothetical protein n=1 Tax=Ruminiclostridium papyrosolvens TaxID=29362 RepID=UPI0023E430AC|nr:hypothetical protein [Ruminiclostridium papyrosolvens]WES33755.1 hypothetical protein P0092_18600 [Ruminiclostridium papyrosolvens DSM 2782]